MEKKKTKNNKWKEMDIHPSLIYNKKTDNFTLKVLDFFFKELTLPKFAAPKKKDTDEALDSETGTPDITEGVDVEYILDLTAERSYSSVPNSDEETDYQRAIGKEYNRWRNSGTTGINKSDKNKSWWRKCLDFMFKPKPKDLTGLNYEGDVADEVDITFDKTKDSKHIIRDELELSLKAVDGVIKQAMDNNQRELITTLSKKRMVLASEIVLEQNNLDTYVLESDIIKFLMKSRRGVVIDYIRNYDVLIPPEVTAIKKNTDKLNIFDNYVVMYYKSTVKTFEEAKAEAEIEAQRQAEIEEYRRTKDPILFGVLEGSRKLYYVTDWINGDDDLTLAQLNIEVENASKRLEKFHIKSDVEMSNINSIIVRSMKQLEESDELLRVDHI